MLFLLALLAANVLAAPASQPKAARPSVTIANGVVVGTSIPGANQYLGIPFAQSPPLRFAPPQPASPWKKPLDASKLPNTCIQQFNDGAAKNFTLAVFGNPGNLSPIVESEDCLYLNVYTPQTKWAGKAVMVWIYGGNLQFGSSAINFYNGSSFAIHQDIIVVTLNYRTNAFGFSNSPEISLGSQNSGFLDQRMALLWVQQNIEAFGGDPNKVTIFGESAGGYSVKQILANPPSPLTFRAAIMESEAAALDAVGTVSWEQLVQGANCTTATSQLACMRQVPATSIKNIIESGGIAFPPAYDGVTATQNTEPIFATGKAAQVPFMLGTNANEGSAFADILLAPANVTLEQYLNQLFSPAVAAEIAALYPSGTANQQLASFITDFVFQCPAKIISETATQAGYNVWRYYYEGVFNNTQSFPNAGAYHSSEIPEVFNDYPVKGATSQEKGLALYMQTAWAKFAKNPGSPGWPSVAEGVLQDLGNSGSSGGRTIATSAVDTPANCAVLDPIILGSGV